MESQGRRGRLLHWECSSGLKAPVGDALQSVVGLDDFRVNDGTCPGSLLSEPLVCRVPRDKARR